MYDGRCVLTVEITPSGHRFLPFSALLFYLKQLIFQNLLCYARISNIGQLTVITLLWNDATPYLTTIKNDNSLLKFSLYFIRKKGRDLTQCYDKSHYTSRNVKRAKWQHKQRHKQVRLYSGLKSLYIVHEGEISSNIAFGILAAKIQGKNIKFW